MQLWRMCGKLVLCSLLFAIASCESTVIEKIVDATEALVKELLPIFPDVSKDDYKTAPQLIKLEGYPVEEHSVVTDDGYILTMHRIPGSPRYESKTPKGTVLLQHGLVCSSADWVSTGKDHGLGFLMADAGYDVWLGNNRGNSYALNHTTLSTTDSKFWDFSFDEMGMYDVPAMINYITDYKKVKKLLYVGHSMGTTMFYAMASRRPEIASKVTAMFSLAPICYLTYARSALKLFIPLEPLIKPIIMATTHGRFLFQGPIVRLLDGLFCDLSRLDEEICYGIVWSFLGFDRGQFNITFIPEISAHFPAGTSVRTLLHYVQVIKSGEFKQYDFGSLENLKRYKSLTPPKYDNSKNMVPTYLMYSDNDLLSDPRDVKKLSKELSVLLGEYKVSLESYGHLDFMWAIDNKELLYDKLFSLMAEHNE